MNDSKETLDAEVGIAAAEKAKKYVSPRRREEPTPVEVVCSECGLPGVRGLPPLRAIPSDHGMRKLLRHDLCPEDAPAIMELVEKQREQNTKDYERIRKALRRYDR